MEVRAITPVDPEPGTPGAVPAVRDGLVEPPQEGGGNGGRILLEPTCEITQQSLGLVGIVELPSLPKRAADRRMPRLRQPLDDVARLMDLTTLDRSVRAETAADGFAQHLGALDDEQPADLRVEPARDEIIDQRLDHGGILRRPFDQRQRMLVASGIDAECSHQHQVVNDVQAIDPNDQQLVLREVRSHPLSQALGGQRNEPPASPPLPSALPPNPPPLPLPPPPP